MNTGPAATGSIVGTVASSLGGTLAGVQVVVTPAQHSAMAAVTTTTSGTFDDTGVPTTTDNGTVTVSALPGNCSAPQPSVYTGLTSNDTLTVDITVVCSALVGTVRGTVLSSLGGALPGVGVVVTPHGQSALVAVITGANGAFVVPNVPVADSTGSVTLTNVPANCTAPANPTSYSQLGYGDTVTVPSITLTCATGAGGVTGTVTSSAGGPLAGLQVVVTPAGGTALSPVTTNVSGVYTVSGIPIGTGAGTVTVSGVPGYCAAPGAASYSGLTNGVTLTTNVVVSCATATGTVIGTVTSSLGDALAGVQVVVTPTGGTAFPAVTTTSGGGYTVSHVPVGGGSVTLSGGLPPQCSTPTAVAYSGLAYNATATANVVAPCQQLGSLTVTIIPSPTNGSVTVTGPSGPIGTYTQTTTIPSLAPGTYTVTAASYEVPNAIVPTVYDATIAGSAQVTAGATSGVTVTYAARGGTGALWLFNVANWSEYTSAQLSVSGTPTPVASGATSIPGEAAVDANGTMWVTSLNHVLGFAPAKLAAGDLASASITLTEASGIGIEAPTFDAAGNLWVLRGTNTIEAFTRAQLAAGGSQNATYAFLHSGYLRAFVLAFDRQGDLWISNQGGLGAYVEAFTPAQQAAGGSQVPDHLIVLPGYGPYIGMAFDANWNLWVSVQGPNQIYMYTPSQWAAGGSPTPTVTLNVSPPSELAFDASGNLWVHDINDNQLLAFTALQIQTSGTPTPALTITVPATIAPFNFVFDPHASTLPLAGSRVISHPRVNAPSRHR